MRRWTSHRGENTAFIFGTLDYEVQLCEFNRRARNYDGDIFGENDELHKSYLTAPLDVAKGGERRAGVLESVPKTGSNAIVKNDRLTRAESRCDVSDDKSCDGSELSVMAPGRYFEAAGVSWSDDSDWRS